MVAILLFAAPSAAPAKRKEEKQKHHRYKIRLQKEKLSLYKSIPEKPLLGATISPEKTDLSQQRYRRKYETSDSPEKLLKNPRKKTDNQLPEGLYPSKKYPEKEKS